jgi:hypothetical protein
VRLTAINKVPAQTQPHQRHQTQGSPPSIRRTVHDLRVSRL